MKRGELLLDHMCSPARYTCPLCGERFCSYSAYYKHVRHAVEKLAELGYVEKTGLKVRDGGLIKIVFMVDGDRYAVGVPEAARLLASRTPKPPSCRTFLNTRPPISIEALEKALRAHLEKQEGTEVRVLFIRIRNAAGLRGTSGAWARAAVELLLARAPPGGRGDRVELNRRKLLLLIFSRLPESTET
ncbi:MAG: hypothetical protein QXJ59_04400 [Thermofilaceae archaeon]